MSKAVEILNKLRDRYVKRIADFLSENEEQLLDHAEGNGYSNLDELLVVGEELRQISVILGCMPADPTPAYPQPESQVEIVTIQPISFVLWSDQIRSGNYQGAVASLSYLFEIDIQTAARCVTHFINLLGRDTRAFAKVQQIREHLRQGRLEGCLALLNECFGLTAVEAVHVASLLKQRI